MIFRTSSKAAEILESTESEHRDDHHAMVQPVLKNGAELTSEFRTCGGRRRQQRLSRRLVSFFKSERGETTRPRTCELLWRAFGCSKLLQGFRNAERLPSADVDDLAVAVRYSGECLRRIHRSVTRWVDISRFQCTVGFKAVLRDLFDRRWRCKRLLQGIVTCLVDDTLTGDGTGNDLGAALVQCKQELFQPFRRQLHGEIDQRNDVVDGPAREGFVLFEDRGEAIEVFEE